MITIPIQRARELVSGFRTLKLAKSGPPALRCLRFVVTPGRFEARATNLTEWLIHSGDTPATGTADLLVPFELFAEAAKAGDSGSALALQPGAEGWDLTYRLGGQAVSRPVPPFDLSAFPQAWEFEGGGQPLPAGFIRTLQEALTAASTDSSRYLLNGVWLGATHAVATDGRQLYASNSLTLALPGDGITLPGTAALRVFDADAAAELLLRTETLPVEGATPIGTHAALRQGSWIWAARLIEGRYPDWRHVVPRTETLPTRVVLSEADAGRLLRVLPRLPGFRDANAPLTLVARPGATEFRASAGGSTVAVTVPDSAVTGSPVTTRFNREFLLLALAQGFRTLYLRDDRTPLLMRDDIRTRLWMPIRLDSGPADETAATPSVPATEPGTETQPITATKEEPMVAPVQREASPETPAPIPADVTPADPVQHLQRARELLRELNVALGQIQTSLRESARQQRATLHEYEALKRNLRALKSVEV